MIIRNLKLHNIRSYVDENVLFPDGAILFEGDVGSGKTTILISIEFALFGLSYDLKGEYLLRTGCSRGSVELTIEVSGKTLLLKRSLEKTNGKISQVDCYLVLDNVREDYSVSEMKARVLAILGFNERVHPQASSLIYRYAIFTPQERMKEILLSNADERLETIRRAFMMEEYKNAAANSEEVQKSLKIHIKAAENSVSDLEKVRKSIKEYETERGMLDDMITTLDKKIHDSKILLEKITMDIEKLHELKEKHAGLKAEINSLDKTIMLEESNARLLMQKVSYSDKKIQQTADKIKILTDKKSKLETDAKAAFSLLGMDNGIDEKAINAKRKTVKAESEELLSQITRIKSRMEDMKKLVTESVCPLCEQNIDANHFKNKMIDHSSKLGAMENAMSSYRNADARIESLLSAVSEIRTVNSELGMFDTTLNEEIARKKDIGTEMEKSNILVSDYRSRKGALANDIERLDDELKKISDLDAEEKKHRKDIEELSNARSSKTQRLKDIGAMIEKDTERVRGMETKLEEIKAAKERVDWLRLYFTPSVENIEKHVFAGYNMSFDSLFRKWFSMLMDSGDISVRIDDRFTPMIEQNGYEQDIDTLSGGEKTSVALAYRLALNTLVKETSISLKNNLLILDEPTDGFSKEQLHRMRDILDELKCNQVIIVSHEKELEAFVDNIIEIRKEGSVSRIIPK
ncbi:MAG: SMC family ATPase [Candidatus Aenigmatarchaeota archaeon]